ncbi:hypothetical protein JHK87_051553 [Glycine soja]|nr:hypothetical protein JHK87_051553 [Glycine soja]
MLISSAKQPFLVTTIFLLLGPGPILARNAHVINFRSPNLHPESLTWDPHEQHFLLGSLHKRIIVAVSDTGIAETFISDQLISRATASSPSSTPAIRSRRRLLLSSLPSDYLCCRFMASTF